jgi:hypothetical protein
MRCRRCSGTHTSESSSNGKLRRTEMDPIELNYNAANPPDVEQLQAPNISPLPYLTEEERIFEPCRDWSSPTHVLAFRPSSGARSPLARKTLAIPHSYCCVNLGVAPPRCRRHDLSKTVSRIHSTLFILQEFS